MRRVISIVLSLVLLCVSLSACMSSAKKVMVSKGTSVSALEKACSDGEKFVLSAIPWDTMEVQIKEDPTVVFGVEPKQILQNSGENLNSTVYMYPCEFSNFPGTISLYFIEGKLDFVRIDFDAENQRKVYEELLSRLEKAFGKAEKGDALTVSDADGNTEKIPFVYYWISEDTEMRLGCDIMALSKNTFEKVCVILSSQVSEH